jgi:fatty acid-binding protein DegV
VSEPRLLAVSDLHVAYPQNRQLVEELRPRARIERVCEVGAVVGTHGGPGTLALLVLAEP